MASIDFGDILYLRDDGLETHFVIRVNTVGGDSFGFVWGTPEEYSDEKADLICEKLEDCLKIVRGDYENS